MALTKIDDRGLKTPIDLLDNEKIRFGDATTPDLEIYHDGSDAYITKTTATGRLKIKGDGIQLQTGSDNFIHCDETGVVQINYNGSPKFETTSVGADVKHTGDARFYVKDTTNSETFGIRAYSGNTEVGTYTDHDWKIHRNNVHTATITSSGIDVLSQTVHLYNSADTSDTYFVAQNTSTGNAGIKMKNSQGEWIIIANDNLRFYDADNSKERLTITSAGNVGIGTDDPFAPTGYTCLEISGSTGGCITFSDDEVQQWEIYGDTGDLAFYHRNHSPSAAIACLKLNANGDVELPTGNLKLPSGKGIDFQLSPDVATGETTTGQVLDDYEYGIWSPTLSNGTATWYNARYVKIGKLVQIWGRFVAPTDDSSNTQVAVESLPFACESNNAGGSCMCKQVDVVASCAYVNTSEQLMFYANNTTNAWTYLKYNGMNATNTQVYFQASYRAVA